MKFQLRVITTVLFMHFNLQLKAQFNDTNVKFNTEFKYIEDSIIYLFSADDKLVNPYISDLKYIEFK